MMNRIIRRWFDKASIETENAQRQLEWPWLGRHVTISRENGSANQPVGLGFPWKWAWLTPCSHPTSELNWHF